MGWTRLVLSLTGRSVINPATGLALARVGWRFRRRDWYRRFTFITLTAGEYVRWRMHTAYGRDDAIPSADDVIRYARWATQD
jgi:hypothetical protein